MTRVLAAVPILVAFIVLVSMLAFALHLERATAADEGCATASMSIGLGFDGDEYRFTSVQICPDGRATLTGRKQ